jgi:ribosomal protein S18 acetylase RimI-like enzyme
MENTQRYRMSLSLTDLPPEEIGFPASISVCPVDESDIETLARLEIAGYRESADFSLRPELQSLNTCKDFFAHMFAGKMGSFLAKLSFKLMENAMVYGAIYTFEYEGAAYIADLVVGPNQQGKGLGKLLLSYALQQYRLAGYRQAGLAVTATNKGAIRLYGQFGFQIEKTFQITERS